MSAQLRIMLKLLALALLFSGCGGGRNTYYDNEYYNDRRPYFYRGQGHERHEHGEMHHEHGEHHGGEHHGGEHHEGGGGGGHHGGGGGHH